MPFSPRSTATSGVLRLRMRPCGMATALPRPVEPSRSRANSESKTFCRSRRCSFSNSRAACSNSRFLLVAGTSSRMSRAVSSFEMRFIRNYLYLVQRDCDRTLQRLAQGRTGGSLSRDTVIIGGFAGRGQPGRVRLRGVRRPRCCGKGWACKRFPFGFSGLRAFREGRAIDAGTAACRSARARQRRAGVKKRHASTGADPCRSACQAGSGMRFRALPL